MADIIKPKIKARYYIITTEKFPSHDKTQYKRYLRYSDTEPTNLAAGEEVIKVAVVTYPDEDPEDPNFKYELDTDPITLSGWDPTEKVWGSCQDWLFYDPNGARDYVDPNNVVTGATIGGFMKLNPTYFYYDSEGLYQGSGEWKNRGSNTATLTAPLINNELADPNKNEITWVDNNWVIDPLPEKIIGYPEFTYVVESDETLIDWANNNHDKGQDYTSVLIRKGSWTSFVAINLTTTGTQVVVGEPGSVLNINGNNSSIDGAFGYVTNPDSPNYYMFGVTVIARGSNSGHAFQKCCYLTNCFARGKTNKTGMASCTHIRNCFSTGTYAFDNCNFVEECTADAYGSVTKNVAFRGCFSVRYCVADDSYIMKYNNSYSSPTESSDYSCSNNLNGGWNQ